MLIAIAVLFVLIIALATLIGFISNNIKIERYNSLSLSFFAFVLTYTSAYAYHLFLTQQLQLEPAISILTLAGISTLLATLSLLGKSRELKPIKVSSNLLTLSRAMTSGLMLCLLTIVFINTPIDQFFHNLKQSINAILVDDSHPAIGYTETLSPTDSSFEND